MLLPLLPWQILQVAFGQITGQRMGAFQSDAEAGNQVTNLLWAEAMLLCKLLHFVILVG